MMGRAASLLEILFIPLILFQTVANSLISLGAFDTPLLLTSIGIAWMMTSYSSRIGGTAKRLAVPVSTSSAIALEAAIDSGES